MKKTGLLVSYVLFGWTAVGCPVCERNQPQILRGITHGAGPDSRWDYLIVWAVALIVLLSLFFTVKWILHPGEQAKDHIKRTMLNMR
jgi:hypothetical protein